MAQICSKCGETVYPFRRDLLIFPRGEKYCDNCGQTTLTAISLVCSNNHEVRKYQKNCPTCGIQLNGV